MGSRLKKKRKSSYVLYSYEDVYDSFLKKKETEENTYDFGKAYEKSIRLREEVEELDLLRRGKQKNIYATKEIKAGDQLEVEIYPQFTRQRAKEMLSPEAMERRRIARRNLDNRNSRKMCERLINENFGEQDYWITFTYTPDTAPESMEQANKNMQNYIRRLNYSRKKAGLQTKAKYIYVTEQGKKNHWHHHAVLDGDLSMEEIQKAWNIKARIEIRKLVKDKDGLVGMSRYITKEKDGKEKYQKTWRSSKGLKKPQESTNHYKTRRKDVIEMVKGEKKVSEHLRRWYESEGYEFAESEIRYNAFNGLFYIYGRMRRTESWIKAEKARKAAEQKAGKNVKSAQKDV